MIALKIDYLRDNPLNAELTPYEFNVLRSHAKRPLREGQTEARLKAQIKLSRLGFLELRDGLYRITADGTRVASASD